MDGVCNGHGVNCETAIDFIYILFQKQMFLRVTSTYSNKPPYEKCPKSTACKFDKNALNGISQRLKLTEVDKWKG
jgi:hypothetical protein